MEFLNALVWAILAVAVIYGALNIVFIAKASYHEKKLGAPGVWFLRFLKSVGVIIVAVLWLIFG